MSNRNRIDVHQHFVPDYYREILLTKGVSDASGRALPEWSVESALEIMDRFEIGSAVLSLSTPGTWFGDDDEAEALAHRINETGAELRESQPRLGFWATVPLPATTAAIRVATRALDELGADGVCLLANNNGRYVGDPSDDDLLAQLNEREAVVFIHPSNLPGPVVDGIPPFAADFLLDTTRATMNLVRNNVFTKFPQLRIILSHAGGFVPYAAHRIAAGLMEPTGRSPFELLDDLSSFYFDTALSGSPTALPSLLTFAKPGHVLFGTDWPFAPELAVAWFTGGLDSYDSLDPAGHVAVDRGNAQILLPRFADQEIS